jgi:hypothetical protein
MPGVRDRWAQVAIMAAVFLASVAVAAYVIRPWIAAPLAFDTAAPVLHFDRIVSGHYLERPLSTTPKPLLTLIYGLIYSATHDWRAISFAALGAWGLCVALAGGLAWRLGGALAAAFLITSLIVSSRLLLETSSALGSVWALLLWIVAGLAVTARPIRWGVAGVALGLAALARLETFLVIGLALAVLAVVRFAPGRWRRPVPGRAWLISVGLLGLPLMSLHDILLIGDPFFWTTVAASYSAAAERAGRVPSLEVISRQLDALVTGQLALSILVIAGAAVLVGLLALGPGVAAFLLFLAARHTFVDARYFVPISVAMIFAAAIGASGFGAPTAGLLGKLRTGSWYAVPDRSAVLTGVLTMAVAVVAIALSPNIAPLDRATRAKINSARHLARTADLAVPEIREALLEARKAGSTLQLSVPVPVRPRVAVELDVPLTQVATYGDPRAWLAAGPTRGQMILIDVDPSATARTPAAFRLSAPATLGGVRLVPLLSDPTDGAWLLQVASP